jgi:uroporphyrin-III C-methyltransferase
MYMAVKHLGEIATALMAGGRAPEDPVTLVSNASMPHQQAVETTLGAAGAFVAANEPPTPAIVVVGRAADWRALLDWYKGPLRENPIG